jgi:hypothetical protein
VFNCSAKKNILQVRPAARLKELRGQCQNDCYEEIRKVVPAALPTRSIRSWWCHFSHVAHRSNSSNRSTNPMHSSHLHLLTEGSEATKDLLVICTLVNICACHPPTYELVPWEVWRSSS